MKYSWPVPSQCCRSITLWIWKLQKIIFPYESKLARTVAGGGRSLAPPSPLLPPLTTAVIATTKTSPASKAPAAPGWPKMPEGDGESESCPKTLGCCGSNPARPHLLACPHQHTCPCSFTHPSHPQLLPPWHHQQPQPLRRAPCLRCFHALQTPGGHQVCVSLSFFLLTPAFTWWEAACQLHLHPAPLCCCLGPVWNILPGCCLVVRLKAITVGFA